MPGRPQTYQGDPGLLGSLIGGVGGFLTGGPAGAVAGAVSGWKAGSRPASPGVPRSSFAPQSPVVRSPGLRGWAERMAPGGATGYEVAATPNGGPPKGYRLNKTGYFLKSGQYVAPQTKYVKIRRRNPMNARALSRAISRIESGKRAAKKLGRITVRKAKSCG